MATKDQAGLTRRQMLKSIGAGGVVGTVSASLTVDYVFSALGSSSESSTYVDVKQAVPPTARAFALSDVRLLDGPFLRAQQRNVRYLLQLEPDRLLHNFRINAGLKPKASVYGGWESVEPWVAIRCHGHTLGHYLSACSFMFAASGDNRFKQRADYIIAQLRECQDATGTALTFQTKGIGHLRDVSLIPFYRIAHERYNLYWKVIKREEVEKR